MNESTRIGVTGKTFSRRECSCYEASPGRFVVQITVWPKAGAAECDFYDVTPIQGAQFGRAAFRFVKAASTAERPTYEVLIDGEKSTCTCPHGTYKAHERGPCRHVLAATALLQRGKLPLPKPAAKPAPAPAAKPATAPRLVPVVATSDGWCDL